MAFADEQSYEEMVEALQEFSASVEERCSDMEAAGTDCVDNTDNDPAAVTLDGKLKERVGNIREALEKVQTVINGLQEEIDRIRKAAAEANNAD